MPLILIIIVIILFVVVLIGFALYYHSRKILREQKNYERGLKMVPMLIHLPPQSTDTEVGSRDARDVNEETVSQAQTLYDIIASTTKKGFKSKFYGQRHFSFEIVGIKGFVYFYVAVPVALVETVEHAITSSYPSARLEETKEYNIFSPVGRSSGTMGGELSLKSDSSYPIATYQEIKRDTLKSLLNALTGLDKEDGAGIQILLRPANEVWRKNSLAIADKKRKGKDKNSSALSVTSTLFGDLLKAPFKPPEEKEKSPEDKQISGSDQSIIEAIEEKAKHVTYEVAIRLVSSSNVSQRAQTILNKLVAAFAVFDSPGRNGFKFADAKDIDSFITSYILRFFPPENNKMVLNSIELATIFHFPSQESIPTTQLERQASKQVDGPRNVPDEGLAMGYNLFRGAKKKIVLDLNDRRRHIYIVGQTGTGKSTFLENLALQDMLSGNGFAFIDPHGDTAEKLLSMVPKERTEDVVYFCPADMDYPLGLNLFEFESESQKDFLIQEAINMLYKLYDPQHQGIIGPRYEHWFRNAALTIMADPKGATFIDIPKVFTDDQYAKNKLKFVKDQTVLDFWNKEMAQTSDYHKSEVLGWFVSKFGAFLSNEMMRNIIGQTKSGFNIREIMDNKKILLVNLSKGRTGELNSKLLGMIFVMKFQAAAMSRANIPEAERKDFALYVDEFQNFSTDSFANILSEARKYRLNLIVANQFTTQLTEEIRDAVFGNVGTIVTFRVGTADAEFLSKQFAPVFDIDDLQRIPNYNTVMRMLIGGIPTQPFSMAGLPPLGSPNKELGDALKQLSAAKFGRPKAVVEKEIFARLSTPAVDPNAVKKPNFNKNFKASSRPTQPRAKSSGSSFLDDWLNKKQNNSFKTLKSPFKQSTQQPVKKTVVTPNKTTIQETTSTPATSTANVTPDSNALSSGVQNPVYTQSTPSSEQNQPTAPKLPVAPIPSDRTTKQELIVEKTLPENTHISMSKQQEHVVKLR